MTTETTANLGEAARKFISQQHKLLIGGEWVEAADGRTFETIDPSTGEVICEVAHGRRRGRGPRRQGRARRHSTASGRRCRPPSAAT